MQPRILALTIILIPLFAINGVYIYSAYHDLVPWCFPYLEGCTSISRAARRGDSIYLFRALMIPQAILIMFYWYLAYQWLQLLGSKQTAVLKSMFWLGTAGAAFLILYVDFLGSEGHVYRLLRRYGIMLYFTLTPLAQMVLLSQLYKLKKQTCNFPISDGLLRYQLTIFILILVLGLSSLFLSYSGLHTFESESIVEWLFAFLLIMLFSSSFFMWKSYRLELKLKP